MEGSDENMRTIIIRVFGRLMTTVLEAESNFIIKIFQCVIRQIFSFIHSVLCTEEHFILNTLLF